MFMERHGGMDAVEQSLFHLLENRYPGTRFYEITTPQDNQGNVISFWGYLRRPKKTLHLRHRKMSKSSHRLRLDSPAVFEGAAAGLRRLLSRRMSRMTLTILRALLVAPSPQGAKAPS